MDSLSSLSFSFVILTLTLANPFGIPYCSRANVVDMVASHHVVNVQSLLPTDVCTNPFKESTNPSTLTIWHRHGPCSPLKSKNKTSLAQIFNSDQLRVDWLHSKQASSLAESEIPDRNGYSLGTGNYVVTIGLGTPPVTQSVVFDTGSDLTWIQCKPCTGSCYPQQEPVFDPTRSSTYANISCTSPDCSTYYGSRCLANSPTCAYHVRYYGDGSQTGGFLATETLTLSPSDVVPKFKFGCGEKNRGFFGKAAGIMGLGRDKVSLVSQTGQKYGGAFSYCLPYADATGYLTFGSSPASDVQFTPMLTNPKPNLHSFYFLELLSITVAGETLPISPTLFSNCGVLIESGTVITRLPPTAYAALRSTFKQMMTAYPTAPGNSLLDTCYDFSNSLIVMIPEVKLNFKGASMDLDFSGILFAVSSTKACLAFAPNRDDSKLAIIGNAQQRKLNVVYDIARGVIGFGPGKCS